MDGIIGLLITMAVVGLIAWLLTSFIPMPEQIKTIIMVVAAIFCLLLLLNFFGVISGVGNQRVHLTGGIVQWI